MPETFLPANYGWKLQRGYRIVPRYPVVEDERELGNVKSVAVADKEIRVIRGLRFISATREAYEYAGSFLRRQKGPAGRFYFEWPELVLSPDGSPTLLAVVAGTQGSRTVFVRYAWKNAQGTTRASPAETLAVPANSLLKVLLPSYPPGVTQAVIYATQGSAGTEQEQTVLTNVQTWTQPDAALLTATTSPLAANTATERPLVKLAGDFEVTRAAGLGYEMTLELEETYT
jgi:hypothetical protein